MADNVSNELKNLNDRIIQMNKNLQDSENISKNFLLLFRKSVQDAGLSVDQLIQSLQAKKIDANKIRLILSLTNEKGETLTAKTLENQIKNITDRLTKKNYKENVQVGFNTVSLKEAEKMLPELTKMLSLAKTEGNELWKAVRKISDASVKTGNDNKGTIYGKALGHRIEDERKARNEIIKLQEKQLSLQEAIGRAEKTKSGKTTFDEKTRSVEWLNKELEKTNRLISQQAAVLQGSKSGRAMANQLGVGEIGREQIAAERAYLAWIRERNALLEKNQRASEYLATKQQKGLPFTQVDLLSQQKIQDRAQIISDLNSKIQNSRINMSQETNAKLEAEERRHNDAMLAIVQRGEQQRQNEDLKKQKNQDKQGKSEYKDALSQQEKNFRTLQHYRNEQRKLQAQIDMQQGRQTKEQATAMALYNKRIQDTIRSMRLLEAAHKGVTAEASRNTMAERLKSVDNTTKQINKNLRQTQMELSKLLPTIRRVGNAFGLYFSVQGLVQFGKKLVETRGQFEMQFVAMKQIIQDTDAATKIWNQTMQQALQSPFKAMQLVDYTKKLAAYRIETEKLFDTTKMLADVSAGLGVDMQRLILAYGQVKAANYLRASEVRQFTEAGVNIYGELAKYFSEIEGRAVGTAEMVERVSKRMVLFSDVEKIFQRMTSEGGAFFNMQEVQADTVRGQIMKLHDAYDQMLNSLGEAKDGVIRDIIDALNSLVRNWKEVALQIQGTAAALGVLFVKAKVIPFLVKSFKAAGASVVFFNRGLRKTNITLDDYIARQILAMRGATGFSKVLKGVSVGLANIEKALRIIPNGIWIFAAIELVERFVLSVTRAQRELNRLKNELEETVSDNVGQMNEEINGYERLIEKLKKTNEGSIERKEILNEISSKYGKYLDFVVDETTKVEDLSNAYDKVVSSIRTYTAEKIRAEQSEKVERAMYDEYQTLISSLTDKQIILDGKRIKIKKEDARKIAQIINDILKEGGSVNYSEVLGSYFGGDVNIAQASSTLIKYVTQYRKLSQELEDKLYKSENGTINLKTKKQIKDYENRKKLADKEIQEQEDRNKRIQNLIKENYQEEWLYNEKLKEQEELNDKMRMSILKKYGLEMTEEYQELSRKYTSNLDAYEKDINRRLEQKLQQRGGKLWRYNKHLLDIYNTVASTEDSLQQGSAQWEKQLIENYTQAKETLKRAQEKITSGGLDENAKEQLQNEIDWANLMIEAIQLIAGVDLRNLDLTKKTTSGSGKNYKNISSLISLLKEMNSEYDKLSKSAYGFAKSQQKVTESFTPAFKEIFGFLGIDISQADTWSKKGLADTMQDVLDKMDKGGFWSKFGKDGGKEARNQFLKAMGEAASEVDIEVSARIREDFQREIEDMFGDMDLTLELTKLNIPGSVLQDMYGMDMVDTADIRAKLNEWYEKMGADMNEEFFKQYQQYLKKLDDEERKLQKQRLKDYSKYLEYQLSERAKLEMEYVRKLAEVQAETAFNATQKKQISEGLKREYEEAVAKQDWEDFKGSEFYVGMFEDLEKQSTASLNVMKEALIELRKNAKNLSPRAMKELVKDLEKIDEIERNRKPPFHRMREEAEKLNNALGEKNIREVFQELATAQSNRKNLQDQLNLTDEIIGAKVKEQKANQILQEQGEQDIKQVRESLELWRKALKFREESKTLESENPELFRRDEADINTIKERIKEAEAYIDAYETYQEVQNILKDRKYTWAKDFSLEDLLGEKDFLKEQLKLTDEQIADLELIRDNWDKLKKAENDALDELKEYLSLIQSVVTSMTELSHTFGRDNNPLSEYWDDWANVGLNSLIQGIDAFKKFKEAKDAAMKTDTADGVTKGLLSGDYIKLAIVLLGILIQIVNKLGLFRGAKIDKAIEDQQKKIDALSMAYDRLNKSIERTLTTMEYMSNMNQMTANIQQQIVATEAQLAAARQRKNPDQSEINGYIKGLQDLQDQLEDIQQQQIEVFGGVGRDNYRSWAEGFVSVWKDAFLETGDGLDALQDHFNEFLQNWFVKQATMRIAAKTLEPIMSQIDATVSDNGEVDWNELRRVREQMALILPNLSERLADFAGMWGLEDTGGLSGLAAGIQGMTEEQANILESYWNSVRQMTASIDVNVAQIANILGAGGAETNPQLQQLQTIAANTRAMSLLLESATKSGHPMGGVGFKVFND